MKMLVTAALIGGLGLALPTAGVAQEFAAQATDVRIVPISIVGTLDGIRASAVAGSTAERAGLNNAVENALDRRNIDASEVAAVYLDQNGTYWVYVDLNNDNDE